MQVGEQVKIGKDTYNVERIRPFEHNGNQRMSVTLRKPNGKRLFNVIVYETGALSSVVPV